MQTAFGAGVLFGVPLTDATGAAIATPTPVQFGNLQDAAVDMSFDQKLLYGSKQFPIGFGRGKGKMEIKCKTANFNAAMVGVLFFGITPVQSLRAVAVNQAATVPATTTYTVTPIVPSSGTWSGDLGVVYQLTGLPLTQVATAPALGQYSVSAGVYTFSSADASASILISYEYTATSAASRVVLASNQLMGYAPAFGARLTVSYLGKKTLLEFPMCIANKFTFPLKNDDFTIPEFDITAISDASGNVCYGCFDE